MSAIILRYNRKQIQPIPCMGKATFHQEDQCQDRYNFEDAPVEINRRVQVDQLETESLSLPFLVVGKQLVESFALSVIITQMYHIP